MAAVADPPRERRNAPPTLLHPHLAARLRGTVMAAIGLFALLALASYHATDLRLLSEQTTQASPTIRNIGGVVGAWVAFLLRGGFGYAALILPILCLLAAGQLWHGASSRAHWVVRVIASTGLLASVGTLAALWASDATSQTDIGGMIGYLLVRSGRYYLGAVGTGMMAGTVALFSGVLVTDHLAMPAALGRMLAGVPWWPLRRRSATAAPAAAPSKPVTPRIRLGPDRDAQ